MNDYQMGSMNWMNPTNATEGIQNMLTTENNPNIQFDSSTWGSFGQPGGGPPVDGLDWNNIFGNVTKGVSGVVGLANVWAALKGLKEQKRMNNWKMGFTEDQYANNLQAYNNAYRDQAEGKAVRAAHNGRDFDMSAWLDQRKLG